MKCSTCFRRFLRPSLGAQKLYIQHRVLCQTFTATCHCRGRGFGAPDDGRRNRPKYAEHFTEIKKLCNVSSCWLYLKIHLRCTDTWASNMCYILYDFKTPLPNLYHRSPQNTNLVTFHPFLKKIIPFCHRKFSLTVERLSSDFTIISRAVFGGRSETVDM